MSHHLYRTEGFVLSSEPRGENSKKFLILTEHLGKISAVASGSRKLNSKTRSFLQEGALVDISLLKGKTGWRITTVKEKENCLVPCLDNSHRNIFLKVMNLVQKFLPFETKEESVFKTTKYFFDEICLKKDEKELEIYIVSVFLKNFVFLPADPELIEIEENFSNFIQVKQDIKEKSKNWVKRINLSIKESDLS